MTTTRDSTGSDGDLPSSATSRSLLARVQADEPQAWERLVHLYAPLVLHWCRGYGLQDQDLADIFQDVFQAVVTHVSRFRKERADDTFRGWLRRITQNKLRDHYRRLGHDVRGVGGSSAHEWLAQLPQPTDEEPIPEEAERGLFARALSLIRRGEFRGTHLDGTVLADHRGRGQAAKDVAALDLSMTRPATSPRGEIARAASSPRRVGRSDGLTPVR